MYSWLVAALPVLILFDHYDSSLVQLNLDFVDLPALKERNPWPAKFVLETPENNPRGELQSGPWTPAVAYQPAQF
jgi:hypothetical protein